MASRVLLKTKIEKLIELKNKYENARNLVESIRKKKSETENEVLYILQSLNMEDKTIIVNNQKIIQKKTLVPQGLTFKYIEEVLQQYNNKHCNISNSQLNIKELLKFIKTNRPKYAKTEIKID
tara:strand:- start:210 stop:578 length:369 start_codon:yes stop_codon:yes gene_type:complete